MPKKAEPKKFNLSIVEYVSTPGLHLNALLRESEPHRGGRRLGVIALHGSEGSAMSGINLWLAPYLAASGYTVMSLNKRNSGQALWSSNFDWAEADIRAGVEFMTDSRAKGIVLIGHSLGAGEAVYYQGKTNDPKVKGLVLLGAPRWPKDFLDEDTVRKAKALKPGERFFIDKDGWPRYPEYYLSYWGPESNNNIRKWIAYVTVPILNIAHDIPSGRLCSEEATEEVSRLATNSPAVTTRVIKGANHAFAGHSEETARLVSLWLAESSFA